MSGGVLLARVSLNEKLLAVTDHRGLIVLVSEDASWALGVPGPASSFIGSSLLDHLTDEDKIEYKVRADGGVWGCLWVVGWAGAGQPALRQPRESPGQL